MDKQETLSNVSKYMEKLILFYPNHFLKLSLLQLTTIPIIFPITRYIIKPIYSFTFHISAKLTGDVTILHIPNFIELSHGYPTLEHNTMNPEVCVWLNGHYYYGTTKSLNVWHSYMLHIGESLILMIDGEIEINQSFSWSLMHTCKSILLIRQFVFIGCDSNGSFGCHNCMVKNIRMVYEKKLSRESQNIHLRIYDTLNDT
jgi:hypothetical protein